MARPCSGAEEARLLDEAGSGVVPVNTETRVRVNAIEGQLALQRGEAGALEFRSESIDKEGAEVPVALWTDADSFRLEPPKGRATIRTRLTVLIPPGMRVRLDLEHASASIVGIDSELAVAGKQLQVEAQGLLRPAQFEVEGGAVKLYGVAKGVTVRGRELDVVLDRVSGRTEVRLIGGSAKFTGLLSGLLGDFTGTSVAIDTVADPVSLHFDKGNAAIARLSDGGDITLTGCPLRLEQVGGEIAVTSDSQVLSKFVHLLQIRASSSAETRRLPDSISETDGRCRPRILATWPWETPAD
jgi:hypothetical protein